MDVLRETPHVTTKQKCYDSTNIPVRDPVLRVQLELVIPRAPEGGQFLKELKIG